VQITRLLLSLRNIVTVIRGPLACRMRPPMADDVACVGALRDAVTGTTGSYWCSYWIPPAVIDSKRHYRFNVARLDGHRIVGDVELVLKSSAVWYHLDLPQEHARGAEFQTGLYRHSNTTGTVEGAL
jgi:hypothetical protein